MKKTKQVGGSHYEKLKIQPIEYIMANDLGFCEGCVVKYVTRYEDKGGALDLMKAKQCIDFIIDEKYGNQSTTYNITKDDIKKFKNILKLESNKITFDSESETELAKSINRISDEFLGNFNDKLDPDVLASNSILSGIMSKAEFICETKIDRNAKKEILLNMLYYARDISIGCINRHREQK